MEYIIVGFSTPKSFNPFSWAIKLIDHSQYSHTYIRYFDSYTNRWIVYQASSLVVNSISKNTFDKKEFIYAEFEIPITSEIKLKTIQFAIDKLGTPYGWKSILGILCIKIMNIFNKRIKNPFKDGGQSFVCSELVSFILDNFLLDTDKLDPETATPTDVYNFLIEKGFKLNG